MAQELLDGWIDRQTDTSSYMELAMNGGGANNFQLLTIKSEMGTGEKNPSDVIKYSGTSIAMR